MAEICLDCWNKINKTNYSKRKYILSDDLEFCENCKELKPVLIIERKAYYMYKYRYFILPFKIIYYIIDFLLKLLILPYLIYRYKKIKNKENE